MLRESKSAYFTIGRIVSTEWGCHRDINEGQEEERGLADWPFLSRRCSVERGKTDRGCVSKKENWKGP